MNKVNLNELINIRDFFKHKEDEKSYLNIINAIEEITDRRREFDKLAKTADGVAVYPGMEIYHCNMRYVIRTVNDGGEYGYTINIENVEGSQGWVQLSDCFSVEYRESKTGKAAMLFQNQSLRVNHIASGAEPVKIPQSIVDEAIKINDTEPRPDDIFTRFEGDSREFLIETITAVEKERDFLKNAKEKVTAKREIMRELIYNQIDEINNLHAHIEELEREPKCKCSTKNNE